MDGGMPRLRAEYMCILLLFYFILFSLIFNEISLCLSGSPQFP